MNGFVIESSTSNVDNRVLDVDSDGYYLVNLGELNCYNSNGDFYEYQESVRQLIESESSSLVRRMKSGYLKGEVGHPEYKIGMRPSDFYHRNNKIDLNNTAFHIKMLKVEPTNKPSGHPNGCCRFIIKARIKPDASDAGQKLKSSLDDPCQNTAFSIRSFTDDRFIGGVRHKVIKQIVTWDWVLEPGIKTANKWSTLSKESISVLSDVFISNEELIDVANELNQMTSMGFEDNLTKDLTKELLSNINNNNRSILRNW